MVPDFTISVLVHRSSCHSLFLVLSSFLFFLYLFLGILFCGGMPANRKGMQKSKNEVEKEIIA